MKYLLSQSDIFAHFGVGSKDGSSSKPPPDSSPSPAGRRSRTTTSSADADLDEDELAMANEAVEDDDVEAANRKKIADQYIVTKQPSIITGGELRSE